MEYFDEDKVRKLLQIDQLIRAMRQVLGEFSAGKWQQPLRGVLAQNGGFFGVMPASGESMGIKMVTFYPGNTELPTHMAVIALFDPKTGEPLALMDGRYITEMRTAAVSAVATDHLGRADTPVLAILGSGVQARSHLEALRIVRKFREVRVWSPRHAREFASKFGVSAAASAEEAVRGADVIVVATSATTPVLRGEWLSPGAHINAVGATRPDWRELDDEVLRKARIYVESREAATKESGDIIAAGKIFAELGEVVAGSKPGRQSDDETTLYKSIGVAIEDICSAELVYRRALAAGI